MAISTVLGLGGVKTADGVFELASARQDGRFSLNFLVISIAAVRVRGPIPRIGALVFLVPNDSHTLHARRLFFGYPETWLSKSPHALLGFGP